MNLYNEKNKNIIRTLVKKLPVIFLDIVFFASLILLTVVAAKALTSNDSLNITVSLDKEQYAYNEQIQVILEAENLTGVDIPLSFSSGCQMSFVIHRLMKEDEGYPMPVHNSLLNPRNCDTAATDIAIPDGRKAIWTRTYDPAEDLYDVLPPGQYILYGYITEYEDESWSNLPSSYVQFEVLEPTDGQVLNYDENYWNNKLCLGTGGTYDNGCTCPVDHEWNTTVGCTDSAFSEQLCILTGGVLTETDSNVCYCVAGGIYNIDSGCPSEYVGPYNGIYEAFNDIEGHWAEEYITALQELGVVSGYDDGGFHPDDKINRAELVKMALSAAGIEREGLGGDTTFLFNDLDEWQIPWVYTAWKLSIVEGYNKTTFAPAQNVTRAEALKIGMLAFNKDVPDTSDQWAFEDTVDHWAISYINQAYLDYIISGREDGKFYPNDPITRAEAAKIIKLLSE